MRLSDDHRLSRLHRMVERYQETSNVAAVAREFGLSRERTRLLLRRAGIDTARKTHPGSRGGERPGAGRRAGPDGRLRVHGYSIAESQHRFLQEVGESNASAGLRAVIDEARKLRQPADLAS